MSNLGSVCHGPTRERHCFTTQVRNAPNRPPIECIVTLLRLPSLRNAAAETLAASLLLLRSVIMRDHPLPLNLPEHQRKIPVHRFALAIEFPLSQH